MKSYYDLHDGLFPYLCCNTCSQTLLYTPDTDTQEITAVMETTNATITCHFTNGTLCKRCTVKLSRNNLPTEEITLLGDRDSLTGSGNGTIAGLIPGCSYSLIDKSDGARSPIEVEGKLLTKEGTSTVAYSSGINSLEKHQLIFVLMTAA